MRLINLYRKKDVCCHTVEGSSLLSIGPAVLGLRPEGEQNCSFKSWEKKYKTEQSKDEGLTIHSEDTYTMTSTSPTGSNLVMVYYDFLLPPS